MGVNYDYYRIFYHVAKYRSFTQAANALMNSQPNITRAIKNLEQELGCTLFIRTNRLVKLTPEGEALYRHVSVAFDQLQAGEEEITRGKGLDGGILRIAATEVALRAFLLPVLAQFRTRHPGVRIKLFNGSTAAATTELENGLADLAFVTTPADITARLRSIPLANVQDIAVCGSAYSSLAHSEITIAELSAYPIISLGEHGSTYRFYTQFFAKHRIAFKPDIEAATADQVLPMVKANLGIGFVPSHFLSEPDMGSTIFRINLAEQIPLRQICLVESIHHPASPAAQELKNMCAHCASLTVSGSLP